MAGQAEEYMKSLENYYKAFCRHHRISCDESMNPFKKILKIQARDYSTYRIPELSQTYLGDFLRYLKENTDQPVDPVNLLAEKAASEKRLTYLSQLGRYSLKVWGDEGWKRLESEGLRYMGYAGHKYEINKIYSASTINIDINRLYQADMVNMRVFDIMACGGFVIAEHSEDLKELFEIDDEVVTFRTFGELLEKVDYYLSNTDKAREISYRGMTAVRERHTIQNRVKHMLSIVNKESYL
jgi:spore maturation protein CgeB